MSVTRRFVLLGSLPAFVAECLVAPSAAAQETCFERIDTGVDMTGWQTSSTNPHGPGEGWTVEDGAFVGRQTEGQQGGILMTSASYQDVEVVFEVKIDWGCDSGFFFRTTDGNRAYQVTIDHLTDSSVGTIWGESFPEELRAIPYWLTDDGNAAIVAPDQSEQPIFDLSLWPTLWNPIDFNEIRARIEDNPPHIQVWISGTQVMDFTDSMLRNDVTESGPLAIQVHGGDRWLQDGTVAFKNIRVRDLTVPCDDPGSAGAGGGGAGGTTTGDAAVTMGGAVGLDGSGTGGATGTSAGSDSGGVPEPGMGGATSGAIATGGSGAVATGSSGVDATPSTTGDGTATTSSPNASPGDGSSGCACRVAPRAAGFRATPWLLFAAAGMARRRRLGLRSRFNGRCAQ